ncbi:MAG: helix-turn-helix domain-containing protein [Casimicrobiaceae bacterium]
MIAPGPLGLRIAELAAHGWGVRQIARILGVNPSTVSRRLRRAS